ncbi:MAG: tRNA lysidine(34) synthetase TilS [Acidobacteriota bacterium]
MTEIAARVRRYVDRHQLWLAGGRVVAAVSGGADSVALLVVLRELHECGAVSLVGVAHLNHQLRVDAARDEAFTRALAVSLDVPVIIDRVDVSGLARQGRCSTEVAARRARYAFLERARVDCGADHVAVAHTRDDQAETVLMRLFRGTGTRGLRGILPARGRVVRPLLECSRASLRRFLAARQQAWVEDETNADLDYPRNRVRHELLPLLAARYRPSVSRVLARTADIAAHEDAFLERLAAQGQATVVSPVAGATRVAVAALNALPLALRRRVAWRALVLAGISRTPTHSDVERLVDACAAAPSAARQLPGLRVERFSPDAVLLIRDGAPGAEVVWPGRALPVPGALALPELGAGCRFTAIGPIKQDEGTTLNRHRIALRADAVVLPLAVRGRKPGDRIQPVGLGGTKKLQDLMVDRKVPRVARNRIPVVADANGQILWVVGLAVAAHAAAGPQDDVIVLTFEQPAQAGSGAP